MKENKWKFALGVFLLLSTHCESREPPESSILVGWTPTEHQTNMAYFLDEHFCRFTLSDEKKIAMDGTYSRMEGYVPDIPENFKMHGLHYTNFVIHCVAFSIPGGLRNKLRFIAVQHYLPGNTNILANTSNAQSFTVYYGIDSGHVGCDLGMVPFFSSPLPYHIGGKSYR